MSDGPATRDGRTAPDATMLVHATAVAVHGRAILLRGPSGSGKSDLALRLIDGGAHLVADDQCELRREHDRILVGAPPTIAGLIEVRGVGILRMTAEDRVPLALVADLVPGTSVERLPDERAETLLGIAVPIVALDPFAASATAKLRLALQAFADAAGRGEGEPAPARAAGAGAAAMSPERANPGPARCVLVTGMSGAGRSTALKALEDVGYEAVDNLPLALVPALVESAPADAPAIAIGLDARTRGFRIEAILQILDRLTRSRPESPTVSLTVLFIDCDDERLERRYTETRRPHPLAGDRPVMDGIRLERQVVSALRDRADLVIDTSPLTTADLKRLLTGHFALAGTGLRVFVTSFAFRRGIPREADLVFDVRFLDNPHYVAQLRPLTGRDPAVAAHIERDPGFAGFFDGLLRLLLPLLPRYEKEGKSYLTIAVGCTGGRHRSVYVAERLAAHIRGEGRRVELVHRDLPLHELPREPPRELLGRRDNSSTLSAVQDPSEATSPAGDAMSSGPTAPLEASATAAN
jgi:RNase adaptor protein for sRNA GlmZ degradation